MATALEVENHFHRPPLPPHRPPPSICYLHPNEVVTGFCASCLRERLSGFEVCANAATAPGRRSTSALRSICPKVSAAGVGGGLFRPSGPSSSFLPPELRRCRSFSLAQCNAFSGPRASTSSSSTFEPQRRSCDVGGRSTLSSLFHQDDHNRLRDPCRIPCLSTATADWGTELKHGNLGLQGAAFLAPPSIETDVDEENGPMDPGLVVRTKEEFEARDDQVVDEATELKPMKDLLNLDALQQRSKKPPAKDLKEIAGAFLLAASVFSKKLQIWPKKQKLKKQVIKAAAMSKQTVPKSSLRFRDTQSEIAVDAFGRRSCDTDLRFSLDAGRITFDDPRYSIDEPRASWDGYLIGGRPVIPRLPPVLSVIEDGGNVQRADCLIPVEEDAVIPGGSAQTHSYYLDSSNRRRRSVDRSSSNKEQPIEITEPRSMFNAKVAPAGSTELFHFHHTSSLDLSLKNWNSNSLRDYYSSGFESVFRDPLRGTDKNKSRKWSKAWSLRGFIHRKQGSRSGCEGSFTESWPELPTEAYDPKFLRSNSTASSRSNFNVNGAYGSMRKAHIETNRHGNKREQFMWERNASAKHSPSSLRLYSTPMQNSRMMESPVNGTHVSPHYFTRSMLGLY